MEYHSLPFWFFSLILCSFGLFLFWLQVIFYQRFFFHLFSRLSCWTLLLRTSIDWLLYNLFLSYFSSCVCKRTARCMNKLFPQFFKLFFELLSGDYTKRFVISGSWDNDRFYNYFVLNLQVFLGFKTVLVLLECSHYRFVCYCRVSILIIYFLFFNFLLIWVFWSLLMYLLFLWLFLNIAYFVLPLLFILLFFLFHLLLVAYLTLYSHLFLFL